jgi:antitoxin VapB
MLTRVFKSGNSLAVRIPKELGFVDAAQDVSVERVGNTLVLRLVAQETLGDIGDIVAMFSPGFMAQGREFHPERERDWGGALAQPVGSIAQG